MINRVEEIKDWLNKIEIYVNDYAKADRYTTDNFQIISFEVKFVDTIIKVFDYELNEEIAVILPSKYYSLQDSQLGIYIYGAIKNR